MKKILFFLLVLLLIGAMTACSGTPYVGIDSSALEPFVIGGIGPLTEDLGSYGRSVSQGAQIAVEEINATGGVNGFRLVLNFQDSKGDPDTAAALYGKLRNNDMKVLLGGVFLDETAALQPLAAKDGLLVLTPMASGGSALGGSGNMFRTGFSNIRLGTVCGNFVADDLKQERAAVIWSNDSFGGNEQVQAFVSAFSARGGFADLYEIPLEEAGDFASVIASLKKAPPSVIYLALSPQDSEEFLEQYAWDGRVSPVKIVGAGGLEGLKNTHKDPESLEGMAVVTPFVPEESAAVVQNFVTAYRETYGTVPDRYAAEAYDGIYAIAEGLKKAGIRPDNVDNEDFNKKMISAMTKITVHGVTGPLSWTADGEITRPASVKVLRKGVYTAFGEDLPGT